MARFQAIAVALVFSLYFILPFTSARSTTVTYCDKHSDYDVKVSGVKITPNPVRGGEPATFSIAASTDKPISGGKLVIDVYYFGVHVRSETHDICSETSCPILSGDFVVSHSQNLPGFTPPGNYRLRMRMEDVKNQELTCISFNFRIALGESDSVAES
uniref:Putative ML domain protein n=1 Tax=Catharanthus roseus TaxID=4058 RepID=F2VPY9_CATRO|nr:putative ML domain protein [Catharanthus roseus]